MNTRNIYFLVLLFASFLSFAQVDQSDKIIGLYMTEDGRGKVSVAKKGNLYFGMIAWVKVTGTLDMKNPDIKKRHNKLAGTVVLKDLVYKDENIWEGGTIYDPDNGKTYSCKASVDNKSNLRIRGYLGVPLAGRTVLWKRIN